MKKSTKKLCGALLLAALLSGVSVAGTYAYYGAQTSFLDQATAKIFEVKIENNKIENWDSIDWSAKLPDKIAPNEAGTFEISIVNESEVDLVWELIDLKLVSDEDSSKELEIVANVNGGSLKAMNDADDDEVTIAFNWKWPKGTFGEDNEYEATTFTLSGTLRVGQYLD